MGLRISVLAGFAENGGHVEAPWLYFWDVSAQIENRVFFRLLFVLRRVEGVVEIARAVRGLGVVLGAKIVQTA